MHPIGPELPISAYVACPRVCWQLYVLRAGRAIVQATVGVGTGIIVYIGVAYARGGGGTLPHSSVHGAVGILLSLLHYKGGSGRWDSFITLPHSSGQWAVAMLQSTVALCGAVDSGTLSVLPHYSGWVAGLLR